MEVPIPRAADEGRLGLYRIPLVSTHLSKNLGKGKRLKNSHSAHRPSSGHRIPTIPPHPPDIRTPTPATRGSTSG